MKVTLFDPTGDKIEHITLPIIAGSPQVIVIGTKFYVKDSALPNVYHETTGWRFLGEQEGDKQ